jgi:hypothetical protein
VFVGEAVKQEHLFTRVSEKVYEIEQEKFEHTKGIISYVIVAQG